MKNDMKNDIKIDMKNDMENGMKNDMENGLKIDIKNIMRLDKNNDPVDTFIVSRREYERVYNVVMSYMKTQYKRRKYMDFSLTRHEYARIVAMNFAWRKGLLDLGFLEDP